MTCRIELIQSGAEIIPRSCPRCGLGPCEKQTHLLRGTRGLYIGAMEKNREGGLESRELVEKELSKLGITVWNHYKNPIMSSSNEGDEETFKKLKQLRDDGEFEQVHQLGKQIRHNDLALIDKCDFIICELDMETLSCGTWEELFWANKGVRKPIFIYCKQGKKSIPLWLWWTFKPSYIYNNLSEIISTVKRIDSGSIDLDSERWKLLKKEYR